MNNPHIGQIRYHEIINFFIQKFNYTTYLELGVRDVSNTFNHIITTEKEGVDINPNCGPTHCMYTDEFFKTVGNNKTWDIIFIDASHEKNQVLRDFDNALARLNENGTIIMDDINPTEPFLLSPTFCDNAWEAFAELGKRSDIQMHAVTPSFFGFVRKGQQTPHSLEIQPTFEFLNQHREEIVRPITWDELLIMFK
jgi:hypothetical protein